MHQKRKDCQNAYVTQDGGDRESGEDAYIANMQDGCMAGFKYFNMKKGIIK